ncbi:MAG: hypothetical protein WBH51_19505 [Mycolicibacter algericus]|uniref:PE cleavage protein A C-terminal domain-containing protein n=2 Tax=Mycolicibacter algericus TaxID=1288388 RepID=A0A7I9Y6A8_MYCAL|nr:hypothetical protein [Mycolicibacter algericus]OQZ95601.1 hypothetical protein BST10_14745 [Mycolicibacter algericus DSM 45454]GFG84216.1 hypothetical protein MALGJ_08920 [Mycolicibacter algericus]
MFNLRDTIGRAALAGLAVTLPLGALAGATAARAEIDDLIDSVADAASVPLTVAGDGFGQPTIDLSIGGGEAISVALDTGSRGLVVSIWDVPWQDILNELQHFSFDDINFGAFPAGFTVGLDIPTSVDFGNGIVAEHTIVNGLLFSFPFSAIDAQAQAGAPVDGILGIGPNAGGSHLVTADLPGELGQGVLIDEPGGRLVFGAQPDTVDGMSPITTIQGAPFPGAPRDLDPIKIQFGDGPLVETGAVFDSGGKGGWVTSDAFMDYLLAENPPPDPDVFRLLEQFEIGFVPGGLPVSVYAPDGTLLYSYVTQDSAMTVMPNWLMKMLVNIDGVVNTGNAAFLHNPVYISNTDGGAMTFYGATPNPGANTVEL